MAEHRYSAQAARKQTKGGRFQGQDIFFKDVSLSTHFLQIGPFLNSISWWPSLSTCLSGTPQSQSKHNTLYLVAYHWQNSRVGSPSYLHQIQQNIIHISILLSNEGIAWRGTLGHRPQQRSRRKNKTWKSTAEHRISYVPGTISTLCI